MCEGSPGSIKLSYRDLTIASLIEKIPNNSGISLNKCKKFNDSEQLYYFRLNNVFMKKICILLFSLALISGCSTDNNYRGNPNLPNLNFRIQLDLTLPEYNNLQFAGNHYVTYNYGVKGIVVYNINGSQFAAFELSDPNHPPNDCSAMTVEGVIASCGCDSNKYNIITGQLSEGEGQYTMKPYRVQRSGNIVEVWN